VYEAQKRAPGSVAEQALQRIAKLYEIEADIRFQPPDERRRERLERAAPLLEELHEWLSEMLARVSAKSDLAQAIGYTLAHWKALTRYCDDGCIEIDNNAAERALRGVGLGRNNANPVFMRRGTNQVASSPSVRAMSRRRSRPAATATSPSPSIPDRFQRSSGNTCPRATARARTRLPLLLPWRRQPRSKRSRHFWPKACSRAAG